MNLLYQYSKQYWKLFAAALLLAATNQIFSLLDPVDFPACDRQLRHQISPIHAGAVRARGGAFGAGGGGCGVCVAVAKNFQDYFVNVIVQRLGARMYSDGIRIR